MKVFSLSSFGIDRLGGYHQSVQLFFTEHEAVCRLHSAVATRAKEFASDIVATEGIVHGQCDDPEYWGKGVEARIDTSNLLGEVNVDDGEVWTAYRIEGHEL